MLCLRIGLTLLRCGGQDARSPPPPPPSGGGGTGGGGATLVQSEVQHLAATSKPFGRIAVTWVKQGDVALHFIVRRIQVNGPQAIVFSANNYGSNSDFSSDGFADNGPFVLEASYYYEASTYENPGLNPTYIFHHWLFILPGLACEAICLPALTQARESRDSGHLNTLT